MRRWRAACRSSADTEYVFKRRFLRYADSGNEPVHLLLTADEQVFCILLFGFNADEEQQTIVIKR